MHFGHHNPKHYLSNLTNLSIGYSGGYSKKSDQNSQWSKWQTIRRVIEGFKTAIPGVQTQART